MKRLLTIMLFFMACCIGALAQETEMEQDLFETMREGDKAAIVAVHQGAEDAQSRLSIDRFNTRLRKAYPNYTFYEAWTSRRLIQKMSVNGVSYVPTPDELFNQLHKEGYTHVLIQSSNIVNGADMQFLRHTVEATQPRFKHMRLGEPLLTDEQDYAEAAQATAEAFGSEKEANVLMCSSDAGPENAQFAMLDYALKDHDSRDWYVGTTGGYPSLESLIRQLKHQKVKKVHIIPFIFTANAQATNEMVHEWAQHLQKAGYKVTSEARCLADVDAIMGIFERHIRHAEKFRRLTAKEQKLIR
ncbi:MAG: sirohydrochlorin cobaltochelatase [Bacteroidaceae bacterium]|nr:sirohydrochlorin cobaltochelatase [Bacteroidaceae bacterium]